MSSKLFLECKDYSVSGEKFELLYNEDFDMLTTSPVPEISELGKYYESEDYISHTDANSSIFDKAYQLVKSYSIHKKVNLIKEHQSNQENNLEVLDIGCGTGDFLLGCKQNNFAICGIEPNNKARELSEKKLERSIYKDILEIENKKFDCITMWHVLEHIPNLQEYIERLKSLLKKDGVLVVAVPNFKSYDARYYGKHWAAYDVPRHISHFSKKSISKLFLKVNMEVVKHVPMIFDSFYVALLSEKYKNGKSNWIKAFIVGLHSNLKAVKSGEYSSLIYIIKNT